MAQSVQHQLEEMVPELHDLLEKSVITQEELGPLVAKRRDFEYQLIQLKTKAGTFLKYVEFEKSIDKRREECNQEKGWKAKSYSDKSIRARIHFIYHRGCSRFPFSSLLWYSWIDFCKEVGNLAKREKVIMKALAQHPHDAMLWQRAASHHMEMNQLSMGRTVMLRGIRTCPQSPSLWIGMAEMEWAAVEAVAAQTNESSALDDSNRNTLSVKAVTVALNHALRQLETPNDKHIVLVNGLLVSCGTFRSMLIAWFA
eukprot:GHVN01051764.1.p2 GENE.GHVN01051764.1~~GHVN01051764.1.p2  ORF type:complete len:256 (+),score=25.32 GHVN01051764.1:1016-1783(+)